MKNSFSGKGRDVDTGKALQAIHTIKCPEKQGAVMVASTENTPHGEREIFILPNLFSVPHLCLFGK